MWYTCKKTAYNALRPTAVPRKSDTIVAIYAVFLQWPNGNVLSVSDIANYLHAGTYNIQLLGNKDHLKVSNLG